MTGRRTIVVAAPAPGAHETDAVVRWSASGATVLCERGHVVAHIATRDWAGSTWQMRLAKPGYRVSCGGWR